MEKKPMYITITGPNESSKTTTCAAIKDALMKQGYEVSASGDNAIEVKMPGRKPELSFHLSLYTPCGRGLYFSVPQREDSYMARVIGVLWEEIRLHGLEVGVHNAMQTLNKLAAADSQIQAPKE